MKLSNKDYKKIVEFYNLNTLKNNNSYKNTAEQILADKLCRCIKKTNTDKNDESKAIAVCRNSIFKNRNIDFYNFKCKNNKKLLSKKSSKTRQKIKKFSKKIGFNKIKKTKKNKGTI